MVTAQRPSLAPDIPRSPTGISGLDAILRGGLPARRLYLLRGDPGVGKTTLSLQYLLEGVRRGEPGLYISLSETRDEIVAVAESHGWSLDGLSILELSSLESQLTKETQNTIFHPSEFELNKTTQLLLDHIEKLQPKRLVVDSLSELQLMADTALRYRRQMLALKHFFAGRDLTVLLLDDHASGEGDLHVQSIVHGVITIEQLNSDYGADRRRIRVNKLRGLNFIGGYHDALIEPGGLRVFPRLVASEHEQEFQRDRLLSGIENLDALLGGGVDRGTSTLLIGPAGTGKSTIALQYAVAAAQRGEKAVLFLFEESRRTLLARADAIGAPLRALTENGTIEIYQIDPGQLSPGEFVHFVKETVQTKRAAVVAIDSLNGYLQAMPDVKFLSIQLHDLLSFLGNHGVVTLLTVAQAGIVGQMRSPADLTYLADTVVLLRYFEHEGRIRKAVSIIKKRAGRHEETIRELRMDDGGIRVGPALREFQGVLTGVPRYRGKSADILH
ncbi:MAG: circadian clock protein KaiC [Opitutus sp.]|nr:circadian clock protein KaiC [Opitutus sp.]